MEESIVVGTDGSATAKVAVDEAIRIAGALGAELHVVSAYKPLKATNIHAPPEAINFEGWQIMPDSLVDATLHDSGATAKARGVGVSTHAVRLAPVDALLKVADSVQASMIVVGSQGMHGAKRLSLNNVPNQVSHKARCNVLIVNTDARPNGSAQR